MVDGKCKLLLIREETGYPSKQLCQWADVLLLVFSYSNEDSLLKVCGEGGREGGREGWRERGREGGREEGREGGREKEGGREEGPGEETNLLRGTNATSSSSVTPDQLMGT